MKKSKKDNFINSCDLFINKNIESLRVLKMRIIHLKMKNISLKKMK